MFNSKISFCLALLFALNSFSVLISSAENMDEYFEPTKVVQQEEKTVIKEKLIEAEEATKTEELQTQDFGKEETTVENIETESKFVLKGKIISIAPGATFNSTVDRTISSMDARTGDRFFVKLTENIESIPAGSTIEFAVAEASPAKRRFPSPGTVKLKAVRIVTEDGRIGDIKGDMFLVKERDDDPRIKGSTAKERLIQTGARTGTGAAVGGITGASGATIGGGSTGQAALIGLGVGAVAGLVTAGFVKGKEVNIDAGSNMYVKVVGDIQIIMRE